jgi:alcohol dehydrogenase class IV
MLSAVSTFEFHAPGRILFGRGTAAQATAAIGALGRRVFVVVGRDPTRQAPRLAALREAGLEVEVFSVAGEPTIDIVRQGVGLARHHEAEVVVGWGGGSALDAAKAIALLCRHAGDVLDYLEVIGAGQTFDHTGLPVVLLPTTAGTGTEVTRNAVLASPEHGVKVSLRSPYLLARLAIVDPELSSDMPPELTARVGGDALTQLIEPFVSTRASPMSDALCREGLRHAVAALPAAVRDGNDRAARDGMALASLLSGLTLANGGLGIIHGLAGPIGGMVAAPHGAVCAALLAAGMDVNLHALRQRAPASASLRRYAELGPLLTGDPAAGAEEAVAWAAALISELGISPLSAYGLRSEMLPVVVERAIVASSTKTNPITLTPDEVTEIVQRSL